MEKSQYGRRDRLIREKRHDTYREYGKWPEPTICTECGALFSNGRWTWQPAPAFANKTVCPACQRIADKYPAGRMTIEGDFFQEHREEILNLLRNEEALEKGEHPMERIMARDEAEGRTVVTTTGVHIARRLGQALARAYQGELDLRYGDGEKSVLISWRR